MDLDAYFARTGYSGPRTPTLATLNGIALAHVSTIPFENLDVLLGRPIRLDPQAIFQKLVIDRRGGYCFEQNGLLLEVLRELGFEAQPISARVRLQRPRDFTPPRTHMFLRVGIGGESWLADVGVGALSPTAALRLDNSAVQPTPHEPRRLVPWEGRLLHQSLLGEEWADVCEFTLEEMPPIDREVANWFTSAHPASHFKSRLLVARATPEGRMTLLNRAWSVRGADGVARTEILPDPESMIGLLRDQFGLAFPAGTRFECADLDWAAPA